MADGNESKNDSTFLSGLSRKRSYQGIKDSISGSLKKISHTKRAKLDGTNTNKLSSDNTFKYGNYNRYYGYRNENKEEDVRLSVLKADWFESKSVLDIGSNVGHVSLWIGKNFHPEKIKGIDIDCELVKAARKNIVHYIDENYVSSLEQSFSKEGADNEVRADDKTVISNETLPTVTEETEAEKTVNENHYSVTEEETEAKKTIETNPVKESCSSVTEEETGLLLNEGEGDGKAQDEGDQEVDEKQNKDQVREKYEEKYQASKKDKSSNVEVRSEKEENDFVESEEKKEDTDTKSEEGNNEKENKNEAEIKMNDEKPGIVDENSKNEVKSSESKEMDLTSKDKGNVLMERLDKNTTIKKENVFPYNVTFILENYVPAGKQILQYIKEEYDVILCLSVTKWVQLNFGDFGMKLMFQKIYRQLRCGGKLILEPQPYKSYKRRKNLTPEIRRNYDAMKLMPDQFVEFLLSEEVGFTKCEQIDITPHQKEGFQRPIYLLTKE